ncbi:hypothetical protein BL252_06375 [Salmonella enterica]|nr:hypothetical protein [Salmonella enterica]EBR4546806.1 hypothetical protein [Salmonella enterica]
MTIFNGLLDAKKGAIKDGAVPQLAIAIEAPNKKVAENIISGKLWEAYPDNGDNYFKPKIWEHEDGQPHPTLGAFDTEFLSLHSFDGEKWIANTSAVNDDTANLPTEVLDPMQLSARERFAFVLLFSTAQLDNSLLSQVCDYLDNMDNCDPNDEEEIDCFNRYVIDAMGSHEPVKHMHVEGLNNLIKGIFSNFENQKPGRNAIFQYVKKWVDNPDKRDDMVKSETTTLPEFNELSAHDRWIYVMLFDAAPLNKERLEQVVECSKKLDSIDADSSSFDLLLKNTLHAAARISVTWDISIEKLASLTQAIFERFESVHKPGASEIQSFIQDQLGAEKAKRNYTQTHATLDREVACALIPVEPDAKISTSVLRAADEIISQEREDFKRWSMALRTTEQILKYDRASIFGVIQCAPAKDTYHFPESLRRHIDNWLAENGRFEEGAAIEKPKDNVQIVNHGGRFSVEGLMPESPSNQGAKSEVPAATDTKPQQEQVTDTQADQARETLNEMGYGVYANNPTPEPEEKLSEQTIAAIESELTSDTDNLALWKNVFKTDERFTKAFTQNGGGTSINGTYIAMKATREFGPFGIGWGVEVLEERFDKGAPIVRRTQTPNGDSWELISNGSGGYLEELHHTMKVKVWFILNGVRGESEAYGCTPYLYGTKNGPMSDGEAPKKSWTDAVKKALSPLGFSADIFMGLYDNPEYRQQNKAEFAIKNASENAEDAARLRKELDDKLTKVADTLAAGVTQNEVNKVFSPIAREVETHRKAAHAKGDTEYMAYLSSRLRRLTDIKDERLKNLSAAQEQTA